MSPGLGIGVVWSGTFWSESVRGVGKGRNIGANGFQTMGESSRLTFWFSSGELIFVGKCLFSFL